MKRFRFEATDPAGTPVFGVLHCDSVDHLVQVLKGRRQTLTSYRELSLKEFSQQQARALPRLLQLRVGERLQDAMLTGLPAHDAVRAVASEPMQIPFLAVLPWVYLLIVLGGSSFLLTFWLGGEVTGMAPIWGGLGLAAACWGFHRTVDWWSIGRPRRTLLEISDRLESGDDLESVSRGLLPSELQQTLVAEMPDDVKARAASEVMPGLLERTNHLQRLAFGIAVPIAIALSLNLLLVLAAVTVLPMFADIYEGFGVTLPAFTAWVLWVGSLVSDVGWTGFLILSACAAATVIGIALVVSTGWCHDVLSRIPWQGAIFRWSMQARVCKMIAALCRSGADNSAIIATAAASSGFRSVKLMGQHMVAEIEAGNRIQNDSGPLRGLPLSLIQGAAAKGPVDSHRAGIASTFENFGIMLEQAAMAQAQILAAFIRFAVLCYTILIVVITQVAVLVPMFKLLNDLS